MQFGSGFWSSLAFRVYTPFRSLAEAGASLTVFVWQQSSCAVACCQDAAMRMKTPGTRTDALIILLLPKSTQEQSRLRAGGFLS